MNSLHVVICLRRHDSNCLKKKVYIMYTSYIIHLGLSSTVWYIKEHHFYTNLAVCRSEWGFELGNENVWP